ncbi:MAG: hypothetical protein IPJ28_20830 [Betaproteobacteria bacterium]|nr:hypothetical protein [Betaproteobacteria bacterium]
MNADVTPMNADEILFEWAPRELGTPSPVEKMLAFVPGLSAFIGVTSAFIGVSKNCARITPAFIGFPAILARITPRP